MREEVQLVNEADEIVGWAEKIEAHRHGGALHRAFSVFILNARGELLLQRRARSKYHFGGLWTNAACGHPRRDESTDQAAARRLREEVGLVTDLSRLFGFVYHATDPVSGLTEHEYDHVFVGRSDGPVTPDPVEIDDLAWMPVSDALDDIRSRPQRYTPWFVIALPRVSRHLGIEPPPAANPTDHRNGRP